MIAVSFGEKTNQAPYRAALDSVRLAFEVNPAKLDGYNGLILTGGTDVDPARYHQTPHSETDLPDKERDRREALLVSEALQRDIPILAICRGMQFLNVVLGGTLTQHIEGHRQPRVYDAQSVHIREGSRLASILKSGEYRINSRHHQCVASLGEGLMKTAADGDVVEALELPDKRFVLAVQWHPEDRIDGDDRKLFQAFAEVVSAAARA